MSKHYVVDLTRISNLSPEVTELSFHRPPEFDFRAGQYVQLGVTQLQYPDREGASRVLSIASSPQDASVISVAFRNSGSGYKQTLTNLAVGDQLIVEGPYGFFVLPEAATRPLVLIAGGIGVTPFMSMIRHLAEYEPAAPVTLIYGSSDSVVPYQQELLQLARTKQWFELVNCTGHIEFQRISDSIRNQDNALWYVSGPPAMVGNVRNQLHQSGLDEDMIRHEEFTGYK